MGTRRLIITKSLWEDEEVGIGILIFFSDWEAIVQKGKLICPGISSSNSVSWAWIHFLKLIEKSFQLLATMSKTKKANAYSCLQKTEL